MRIVDVIEFEGSPDLLLWKSPIEDFNTMSQLIVDETHEALLLINGNAADLFGPGKHTLSTQNIPILNSIIRIPTDGKTPFPCKVFYVNKVHQMDMTWGTQGAIPLEDPLYDVFLHIMLHGSLSFSVSDTRKFVLKLAGLRDSFTKEKMVQMFRGIISSHVKDLISKVMINGKIEGKWKKQNSRLTVTPLRTISNKEKNSIADSAYSLWGDTLSVHFEE